jgi:hypothetical protein
VVRGKKVRTTTRNDGNERAPDLVQRDFTAPAPNRRWVADFTHVPAWAGIVYVAFAVDIYSRAIVGWSAATNKCTKLVLDALDMGLWRRDRAGQPVEPGLIHHSDAGSLGGFKWSSQHLDQEVCSRDGQEAGRRQRRGGRRCGRRVGCRRLGVSIGSGSGRRSLGVQPARTPVSKPACRQRLELGGFVRLAACHPRTSGPIRAVICRSWSAKRSRFCAPMATESGRSRDIWVARLRRSPGSCAATRRPAAGGWSIGR